MRFDTGHDDQIDDDAAGGKRSSEVRQTRSNAMARVAVSVRLNANESKNKTGSTVRLRIKPYKTTRLRMNTGEDFAVVAAVVEGVSESDDVIVRIFIRREILMAISSLYVVQSIFGIAHKSRLSLNHNTWRCSRLSLNK